MFYKPSRVFTDVLAVVIINSKLFVPGMRLISGAMDSALVS